MPAENGVPPSWKEMRLQEFATLQRGFDLPVQKRNTGMVPVYAANGLVGYHDTAIIEGPGVITGRSGTIGEVLYTERNFWPLNTALYVKDFHGNEPSYVYRFLVEFGLERFSSGTGVPTLNRNIVHKQRILVPPRSIQRKVVEILNAVDDAIEVTRAVIEQTRRLKIVLSQDLLTNGLPNTRPKSQQDSILGKIPMSWVIKPLGQLCISAIDGPFGSNLKTSHYKQSGVRVIRLQNIGIGEFNDNDKAYVSHEHFSPLAQYEAKAGDLLVASMGDGTWPAGRCCEVPEEIQPAMIKADCFRFRIDPRQADKRFVKWYLNSPLARRAIDRGSHGQTRLRLNLANAKRILTPVPPVEEQERIGRIVQVVHDRGVEETRHLEQIVKLKETLSQGLLTGRIPVGTTDKEVA